ncbi:MAG: ribonuclease HI family protein [Patescibacteria group bacterium]|nr:ribonuclease HI family protein [Patescibacteria group bacterium]
MSKKLVIYTDGGARGNPGPAGVGVVVEGVGEYKEYIGKTTNNQAEYRAVILALEKVKDVEVDELDFYLDSELVVKQLNREYKVKNPGLAPLFLKIWNLSMGFKKVTFTHIRREKNKEADRLVNEAIDEHFG